MASLHKAGKCWTIQFQGLDNKRRTIRLGGLPKSAAESTKFHVEQIVSSAGANHALPLQTATWLAGLSNTVHAKLAAVGLTPSREASPTTTLAAFLDEFNARRTDVEPATRINWRHTQRNLLAFFGKSKPLAEVTVGDAKDFERYLKSTARHSRYADAEKKDPLSGATIRKRIGNSKLFFNDAIERELITSNPFAKLKGASVSNKDRMFNVTREAIAKAIDAAPDDEWKLIIALARYGGLRCPSELLALSWQDIDWERSRFKVTSPKTKKQGKPHRWVPLFPELKPFIEAAFDAAPEGSVHVITRYRDPGQNLRTTFQKIIKRAGLEAWPKLFQNLRSSRQTELENSFPSHVVCAWMGNSQRIAEKHYLQVTDAHFLAAATAPEALQKALHSTPEMDGNEAKTENGPNQESPKNAGKPREMALSGSGKVGVEGLEPPTPCL